MDWARRCRKRDELVLGDDDCLDRAGQRGKMGIEAEVLVQAAAWRSGEVRNRVRDELCLGQEL